MRDIYEALAQRKLTPEQAADEMLARDARNRSPIARFLHWTGHYMFAILVLVGIAFLIVDAVRWLLAVR